MTVSLAEVARRCGVSIATASRALNPDSAHPVRAATRQRVIAAARDLGYRSNALGRALRTGRAQLVGILVHDLRDPYFAEYARAISDAAHAAGFLTMVSSSDRDPDTELTYIRMLRDNRASGVFFVASGFECAEVRSAMEKELSLIRDYGGVAIALSPHRESMPGEMVDNSGGSRSAVDHLVALGHRTVGFIGGPAGFTVSREREAGYLLALSTNGIDIRRDLMAEGDFDEESGGHAVGKLFESGDPPTAIFCANDAMAVGCIKELSRRNLSVPEDISVVGFGDIPIARVIEPALTTVSVPSSAIGAAAMRRLLSIVNSTEEFRDDTLSLHPSQLEIRETTAPPKRSASP